MTTAESSPQKTILITGGYGSLGSALVRHLLSTTDHKVRLLGRSESRLNEIQYQLNNNRVTYILADIRDYDRLRIAFDGIDEIYHTAAYKVVQNSFIHAREFVKTNIIGTMNVLDAARDNLVERVLLISTDKSSHPISAYGSSKQQAEIVTTQANLLVPHTTRYASVRGGNIWGSKGSVMERWSKEDIIHVNGNENTTRFHLTMSAWVNFCVEAMKNMNGGEVFIPKCRSWRLGDLACAFSESYQKQIHWHPNNAGDGDKEHETLLNRDELRYSKDLSWCYVIEPVAAIRDVWNYEPHNGYEVKEAVSSDTAARMGIDELRSVIKNGG